MRIGRRKVRHYCIVPQWYIEQQIDLNGISVYSFIFGRGMVIREIGCPSSIRKLSSKKRSVWGKFKKGSERILHCDSPYVTPRLWQTCLTRIKKSNLTVRNISPRVTVSFQNLCTCTTLGEVGNKTLKEVFRNLYAYGNH